MTRFLLLLLFIAASLLGAQAQVPERLQLPIGCGDTLPPVIVTGYARERSDNSGCRLIGTICGAEIKTVENHDFWSQPTIQPALSRAPGVQATPYSGAPGALQVVRIRGAGSLAGNPQPLYVLDGVPVFQNMGAAQGSLGAASLAAGAGQLELNPLLSLPPEDILSVTIVKGPLATARYGAQGQYGVISISTKQGDFNQQLRVRYEGYGGVQQARSRYDLLNARQYGELLNEAHARQGQPAAYSPGQLAALGSGTDWQQELLRTAAVQEHHLSLSGGRAHTRYYVAADYLRQSGVLLNSGLQRYALRANAEQRLTPQLTLTARLALSQTTASRAAESLTQNLLAAPPTGAPYDASGQLAQPPRAADNPVRQALEEVRAPRQRQLLGGLALHYQLSQYLQASLLGHWEQNNFLQTWHLPDYQALAPRSADERTERQFRQLTLGGALDFTRTLRDRHALTAQLAAQWQALQDDQAFTVVDERQAPLAAGRAGTGAALRSYAGQAGYAYAGRYQVQANLRLDGSSQLPAADYWQPTYGTQATWHAQRESWLAPLGWLDRLDLWAGTGRTSNAGNFYDRSTLNQPRTALAGPPALERLRAHEAGLTVGWRARFTASFIAYQHTTSPSFLRSDPAPSLPAADYQIRSKGLEMSLNWILTNHDLYVTTNLVAAWQQSRYAGQSDYLPNQLGQRATDGQPLSTFRGLRYLGAAATTGQPRYQDTDGDGLLTPQDAQNLGSGLPRFLLNLAQDFDYKRWHLAYQADALLGYQVLNTSLLRLDNPAGLTNASARVLDRWTPAHPAASVPGAGLAAPAPGSSYYLQSGSHGRLASLSLSYTVWDAKPHKATVWLGGTNLLVLSGYRGFDPNVSSGGASAAQAGLDASAYPVARTWLLGVRATL
ncbi:MAG: TonB-dependent receptor plug domain-containing protein [Janthinobacterium lividum]